MSGIAFGTNLDSLRLQRSLSASSAAVAKTSERLSSGLRINRASDDAAGLAVAADLDTAVLVYSQGLRNVNDGISLLGVSEGALQELSNITTRQKELAAEAANGTNSSSQRNSLNSEAQALTQEYNRIVASTRFNNIATIDGTLTQFSLQSGFGVDGAIGVAVNAALLHTDYDGSTFADTTAYTTAAGSAAFAVGDLNGDGKDDFAESSSSTVTVRSGDGSLLQTLGGSAGTLIKFADINNDSNLDILTVDASSGFLSVALGNGNGSFKAFTSLTGATAGGANDFAVGDFNGDGNVDVVSGGSLTGDAVISIKLGNGNGTFKAPVSNTIVSATGTVNIMMSDINNDGKSDILAAVVANGPYIGLGNASTSAITFNPSISTPGSFLAVTDITGDGKKDAIIGNTNYFKVLTGTGAGTFSTAASIGITGTAKAAGDFNGDGLIDVLATSGSGGYISLGNADGTFKAAGVSFNLAPTNVQYVAGGDFNGDGNRDIVALSSTLSSGQINYQTAGTALTTNAVQFSLATATAAGYALDRLETQLSRIDLEIGSIGGAQSRLNSVVQNLSTMRENLKIASSNIKDVDVATEVAELVRSQILQQAGTAILAQANSSPQMMLRLLSDSAATALSIKS